MTYADVWEFWLRNRDIAKRSISSPSISCRIGRTSRFRRTRPAAHVDAIRRQVVAAFPGKEILIGEVGWPSAGRMREGALPSPVQPGAGHPGRARARQARKFPRQCDRSFRPAMEARPRRHGRRSLGTVRRLSTRAQIRLGSRPVSNHPFWKWQALGRDLVCRHCIRRGNLVRSENARILQWLGVTANALVGGVLIGWTIENVPVESLGIAGWVRSLALVAVAFLAPLGFKHGDHAPRRCRASHNCLDPKEQRAVSRSARSPRPYCLR